MARQKHHRKNGICSATNLFLTTLALCMNARLTLKDEEPRYTAMMPYKNTLHIRRKIQRNKYGSTLDLYCFG